VAYDRLTAQDTAFLRIEKPNQPQHVGSLSFFEGAPLHDDTGRLRFEEIRSFIAGRLHRVPRLRQRLMFVPFGQDHPIWVDDDRFDLEYHVRLTALPRPGDDAQLHEVMSRIQSQALDRARPLWEMWFVDGLAGDRVGMIIKTHHALGDGIANVDLAMALVDLERDPTPDPPAAEWIPAGTPSPNQLLRDSVLERLAQPAELARVAGEALRAPGRAVTWAGNVARTVLTFASPPKPAPWNVPVTQHRRWTTARIPLDLARQTREEAGCTLNDVVVAACTGALRSFLVAHGVSVEGRSLKAMVPISRRAADEHGPTLGNRVSLMIVDLPVDEPDAGRRLARVHTQTSELKGSGLVDGAQAIIELADQVPFFAAPATRLVSALIPMNLVITNIPGPPIPLYLRGARLLEAYPYVEVVDNEGLTIAVVSYDGQFLFGLTSDRDVIPDLGLISEGIEKSFAELADAVGATSGARAGRRQGATTTGAAGTRRSRRPTAGTTP